MSSGALTLDEALATGQGVERPFRCHEHNDSNASASVNVLKGVWYCYACHASGGVDQKHAPKIADLESMIDPERTCRTYPEAFMRLYTPPVYWLTRFSPWVAHAMVLGQDPFTGDATFPVHTATGILAGVGRRRVVSETQAVDQKKGGKAIEVEVKSTRYLYPHSWSASQTLFGSGGQWAHHDVLMLVEGAADATSGWEVGCPTFACYGSGIHLPQQDLLARMSPKLILLGFDMDDAGEKAVTRAFGSLAQLAPMKRVKWPHKTPDPAATPPKLRGHIIASTVADAGYGEHVPPWQDWVFAAQLRYKNHLEESA